MLCNGISTFCMTKRIKRLAQENPCTLGPRIIAELEVRLKNSSICFGKQSSFQVRISKKTFKLDCRKKYYVEKKTQYKAFKVWLIQDLSQSITNNKAHTVVYFYEIVPCEKQWVHYNS